MLRRILQADIGSVMRRPVFASRISAGFPSPADDFVEGSLDLNKHLIDHPAATFFLRVAGESMTGAGIHPGDLLVVDRSLTPRHNDIVIAVLHGELTVKRLWRAVSSGASKGDKRDNKTSDKKGDKKGWILHPENPAFPDQPLPPEAEIWGVVSHAIKGFRSTR